jgi:peptidoglycan/xylan/chitin deacetylase (PgdA/CDA1 family)
MLLTMLLPSILQAAPGDAPITPNGAVILQYHFVAEDTPRSTSVTPAEFAAHLDALAEDGFTVVPLDQLLAELRGGIDPPPRTVAITFDDGYRSVHEAAFPLLRARKLPFTVFVNTDAIDGGSRTFVSWEALREMQAAGALVANHSASHDFLVRRDPAAPREADAAFSARMGREIDGAQARLVAELGQVPKLFAYPYGEYDDRLRAWLRRAGYLGLGQHSGPVWTGSDFSALPRFPVSGAYARIDDFREKIRMRPLPVLEADALPDPTDATEDPRPILTLTLAPSDFDPARVTCYASGQGVIPTVLLGLGPDRIEARAPSPVPVGRSRYNCTAQARDGTWRWFSQPWLRLAADMPAE